MAKSNRLTKREVLSLKKSMAEFMHVSLELAKLNGVKGVNKISSPLKKLAKNMDKMVV